MTDINFGALLQDDPVLGSEVDAEFEIIDDDLLPAFPPKPYDMESIKTALIPYRKQLDELIAEASIIEVKDAASDARATELGNIANQVRKSIEGIKKEAPYAKAYEFITNIRNLIKGFTDPLENKVERPLKNKITSYARILELERIRKEAEEREAARQLQAKVDAEARELREKAECKAREAEEALKQEQDESARAVLQKTIEDETAAAQAKTPMVVIPVVIDRSPAITRTEAGSAFQKKPWRCRIVIPDEVPREYCVPVQKLLNDAVKAGIRNIPGCEIKQELETNFRR